ncbi:UDP-N-acetylmuramoyl-tripeptide--D-alanyl-D-alanine ligase [Candidatus Puniceispirillum sp.]|nr:UDP-N-acetylmuramoyl-tripeptide--D-alanyl-D-alanine ligase [Candidatus Puniceispirillum sp.]
MRAPLWSCDDVLTACGGTIFDPTLTFKPIQDIKIDSRSCISGDLFVALAGGQQDGHHFLDKAAKAGAAACLVNRPQNNLAISQIVVSDTLMGLTSLGVAGRNRFGGKMVGITGSVGKTGSKDMLAHVLSKFGHTHASKLSYNNHIGVPITLSTLPADYKFAVQEMGMNSTGEIATLTAMARPDIVMITRVANTHSSFFESMDDIAAAKAEIFQGLCKGGTAVLNLNDHYFPLFAKAAKKSGAGRIITFGQHDEAEFSLMETLQHGTGMTVLAKIFGQKLRFEMKMRGAHWAQNALGVLACVEALGLGVAEAATYLTTCPTPKGRGDHMSGSYQDCVITLIDDSYNASPASMTAAFASMGAHPPNIMILSEMLELGSASAFEHDALIPQINKLSPRLVIGLGHAMHEAIQKLDNKIIALKAIDTQVALTAFKAGVEDGDVVFIKGSLGSKAWKIRDAVLADLTINHSVKRPLKNEGNNHVT